MCYRRVFLAAECFSHRRDSTSATLFQELTSLPIHMQHLAYKLSDTAAKISGLTVTTQAIDNNNINNGQHNKNYLTLTKY